MKAGSLSSVILLAWWATTHAMCGSPQLAAAGAAGVAGWTSSLPACHRTCALPEALDTDCWNERKLNSQSATTHVIDHQQCMAANYDST